MEHGKIGIGKSADEILHIAESATTSVINMDCYSTTNAQQTQLRIRKSASATIGTATDTGDADALGSVRFRGVASSAFGAGANINATQRGAAGAAVVPTELSFETSNSTTTTTAMIISPDGEVTKPLQPSFLAVMSTTQTNFALSTTVPVEFDTEKFDVGANFDTGTYTFTAPVTGKYVLFAKLYLQDFDSAASNYDVRITTSNNTYSNVNSGALFSADGVRTLNIQSVADMDASDTALVHVRQTGGTAQTDAPGGSFTSFSAFSGYLLG
jgi:hypothetical protein